IGLQVESFSGGTRCNRALSKGPRLPIPLSPGGRAYSRALTLKAPEVVWSREYARSANEGGLDIGCWVFRRASRFTFYVSRQLPPIRLARLKLLGLQHKAAALVQINASLGGGTVRKVLCYVVFERVARFPRRLGAGYPQHVTKLAKERLAVGP